MEGFGAEFKRALIAGARARGTCGSAAGGSACREQDNVVAIDPELKDAWGVPALRIQCTWGPNELAMTGDMQLAAAEILEAAGATDIQQFNDKSTPGLCIHEMGTARMGRDPKTSVLNRWNQVWDAPNVFVTDGACMTSSGCQNPIDHLHGAHRPGQRLRGETTSSSRRRCGRGTRSPGGRVHTWPSRRNCPAAKPSARKDPRTSPDPPRRSLRGLHATPDSP